MARSLKRGLLVKLEAYLVVQQVALASSSKVKISFQMNYVIQSARNEHLFEYFVFHLG
eukprot:m.235883 g.235883  ORF g.235883 m.235883 type:complete len:58 (-) comp17410_c0_seq2:1379-1552(-)